MRQIVLDTETTGLSAEGATASSRSAVWSWWPQAHRHNKHFYLNPGRDSHEDALKVHGISNEFLRDKPKFAAVADELLEYLRDAEIIIHNAAFDVGFLNKELELIGRPPFRSHVGSVTDTLAHGQGDVPRQAQQPGCAVRPPGRGQLGAHPARRLAGRRAAGRCVHQPHAGAGCAAD
jgi:DNA polymerase III epsilon subunit